MIQNHTVISGTLLSIARRVVAALDLVVSVTGPERTERWLKRR